MLLLILSPVFAGERFSSPNHLEYPWLGEVNGVLCLGTSMLRLMIGVSKRSMISYIQYVMEILWVPPLYLPEMTLIPAV